MHIYKQLVPPSTVGFSLSGSFTGKDKNELIVVRGNNLLQLYGTKDSIVSGGGDGDGGGGEDGLGGGKNGGEVIDAIDENVISGNDSFIGMEITNVNVQESKSDKVERKLIFIGEWVLDGFVSHIGKVRTVVSNDVDCLVISFKYAKLVIQQWDDVGRQFNPISIHFYEKNLPFGIPPGLRSGFDRLDNELKKGFTSQTARAANSVIDSSTSTIPEYQAYHFVDENFPAKFIIDPFNTCLCFLYQKDQMAFLPFTKEDDVDDFEGGLAPIYFPSFFAHASRLDEKISNIINFTFLDEYREPTMAIIYESVETWAPTAAVNKDTVQYLVLSLDLQNRSSTAIISIDNLPYDIDQIISLPAPVGGSLLIGATQLIHIDSTGKLTGLVVNEYSKLVTKMSNTFIDQSEELGNLKLEDSIAIVLENSTDVLIVLKNSKKYVLKFSIEGRKVQGLKLREVVGEDVGSDEVLGITPSTINCLGSNHLFIGSSTGDSKLLKWSYGDDNIEFEITKSADVIKPKVVVKPITVVEQEVDDDDYDDLYADEKEEEDVEMKEDGVVGDAVGDAVGGAVGGAVGSVVGDAIEGKTIDNTLDNNNSLIKNNTNQRNPKDELYDDEYDDIYGSGATASAQKKKQALTLVSSRTNTTAPVKISLHDTLPSYPINTISLGRPSSTDNYIKYSEPSDYLYDLVATTGAGPTGGLAIFQKTIRPKIISDLNLSESKSTGLIGVWALSPRSKVVGEDSAVFDSYLLASSDTSSSLYRIGEEFSNITSNTELLLTQTINAGTLLNNSIILQVSKQGVIFYDADFNRIGNYNSKDIIIKSSLSDPYILLHTATGSITILKIELLSQDSHPSTPLSIQEIEIHPELSLFKSAFITSQLNHDFQPKTPPTKKRKRSEPNPLDSKLIVLVDSSNSIIIYKLGHGFTKYFSFKQLLPIVNADISNNDNEEVQSQSDIQIQQAIIATVGDDIISHEYLFILTSSGEVIVYKPIITDNDLSFLKIHSLAAPLDPDDVVNVTLDPIKSINNGISAVVITGDNPLIILQGYQSPLRIHPFIGSPCWGFTSFNTDSVNNGFAYIDDRSIFRIANLDKSIDYQQQWPVKRVLLGESVTGICYHSTARVYVISVCNPIEYNAVDGDEVPIPGLLEGMEKARSFKSSIKLISPLTWSVIDQVTLEDNEVILDIKSVLLEVSEKQKLKKEYITFGTSFLRGEDLAAKGSFYVYDCIEVVPEPGKPETNRKLKEINNESLKGAVSAVGEVNGYLLVAQGQKVVIRNIQEDKSILPVAFLDLSTYVSSVATVKNLLLLTDAMQNTIIAGFGQEPYRMSIISKDFRQLEVTSGEFIYSNGSLYAIISDRDRKLHLLEYDPDDANTLSGQRLIRRSEFFTGKHFSSMISVPINDDKEEDTLMPLCAADDGSITTIIPVTESCYRALYVIQQQIIDKDDHNACLNPRMNRALGSELPTSRQFSSTSKGLLDYDVISRYINLSFEKRQLYARKVGKYGLQEVLKNIGTIEDSLNFI